jgi:hypothetical protein
VGLKLCKRYATFEYWDISLTVNRYPRLLMERCLRECWKINKTIVRLLRLELPVTCIMMTKQVSPTP